MLGGEWLPQWEPSFPCRQKGKGLMGGPWGFPQTKLKQERTEGVPGTPQLNPETSLASHGTFLVESKLDPNTGAEVPARQVGWGKY